MKERLNHKLWRVSWLVLINGEQRTKDLFEFGLKSVTHLPRRIFKGARVQCCILELKKGYKGKTELKKYENTCRKTYYDRH